LAAKRIVPGVGHVVYLDARTLPKRASYRSRPAPYGGRVVTNPSGGLLSKGHPLGATGLAQCAELVWQLRGQAGPRQVQDATVALQHNIGLGGAAVVTLYEKLS
jgi:acetyl-CoA acetyltransferase